MQLNINGKVTVIIAASVVACSGLGLAVSQAVSSPAAQPAAVPKVVTPRPKPEKTQAPPPQNKIIINNNLPATVAPAPPPSHGPVTTGFLDTNTLSTSIASEQANAMTVTPDSNFDSPGITAGNGISVYIAVAPDGTDSAGNVLYQATGTDSDGDSGTADLITVAPDGSSWPDNGMTWTGPDVSSATGWVTPSVTHWTAP